MENQKLMDSTLIETLLNEGFEMPVHGLSRESVSLLRNTAIELNALIENFTTEEAKRLQDICNESYLANLVAIQANFTAHAEWKCEPSHSGDVVEWKYHNAETKTLGFLRTTFSERSAWLNRNALIVSIETPLAAFKLRNDFWYAATGTTQKPKGWNNFPSR